MLTITSLENYQFYMAGTKKSDCQGIYYVLRRTKIFWQVECNFPGIFIKIAGFPSYWWHLKMQKCWSSAMTLFRKLALFYNRDSTLLKHDQIAKREIFLYGHIFITIFGEGKLFTSVVQLRRTNPWHFFCCTTKSPSPISRANKCRQEHMNGWVCSMLLA